MLKRNGTCGLGRHGRRTTAVRVGPVLANLRTEVVRRANLRLDLLLGVLQHLGDAKVAQLGKEGAGKEGGGGKQVRCDCGSKVADSRDPAEVCRADSCTTRPQGAP